ncbi:MAG: DUF3795 domain-containing protein [Candidatus Mcinerneyibacterium aminivorans]|jgi:hypothetical protein|uniref:DUF3795 domain-containing protein n=1 Tax=Candidatus Mcinerneyibacterium aminivorans TaxID=2703815 RepID=A0A5D0MJX3_9BACT|nr:MAG: DUF3795 domain-containing protein [Candidatus Mcinerneyibacterium aminivorans]
MELRYDSYCGLYCGACPFFNATVEGEEKLDKLYEKIKENNNQIEKSDLKCKGCKSNTHSAYCENCEIRVCIEKKDLNFCYECDQYPCEFLSNFRKDSAAHHSIIFKNLETIQMLGVDKWIENQEKRWQCDNCSEKFTWYKKICDNCNKELFNAVKEEELLEE